MKKAVMSGGTEKALIEWSKGLGITVDELIMRMMKTISILYDDRLRLADVLNIPKLERILREKGGGND